MTLGHVLVDAAIEDLRLTQSDLNAFRVLWTQLDFETFRPKKTEVLAAELGIHRSNASRSLSNLVALGYIEEGPRDEKGVGTFRLPRAAPSGVRHTHTFVVARKTRRQLRDTL